LDIYIFCFVNIEVRNKLKSLLFEFWNAPEGRDLKIRIYLMTL